MRTSSWCSDGKTGLTRLFAPCLILLPQLRGANPSKLSSLTSMYAGGGGAQFPKGGHTLGGASIAETTPTLRGGVNPLLVRLRPVGRSASLHIVLTLTLAHLLAGRRSHFLRRTLAVPKACKLVDLLFPSSISSPFPTTQLQHLYRSGRIN